MATEPNPSVLSLRIMISTQRIGEALRSTSFLGALLAGALLLGCGADSRDPQASQELPTPTEALQASPSLQERKLLHQSNFAFLQIPFDPALFDQALNEGANPDVRDEAGRTPLFYLSRCIARFPSSRDTQYAPLLQAIQRLISMGANPNAVDHGGEYPLQIYIRWGGLFAQLRSQRLDFEPFVAALQSSVLYPMDWRLGESTGGDALRFAVHYGLRDFSTFLLKNGANPHQVQPSGYTHFHGASSGGNRQMFEFIRSFFTLEQAQKLAQGVLNTGSSALHFAAAGLNVEGFDYLTQELGVRPSGPNNDEMTALDRANWWLQHPRASAEQKERARQLRDRLIALGDRPFEPSLELRCDRRNEGPWNLDRLTALIEKCELGSVEAVLALTPRSYMTRYSLVYRPRGIQKGDEEFPRVILFGPRAQFITAFAGHEEFAGGDSLELIQYREEGSKRSFEFREIQFAAGKAHISQANPNRCLNCHNPSLPRPNWDTWFLYPGVYGSEEGTILKTEAKFYERFEKQLGNERYRHLPPRSDSPLYFDWGRQFNSTARNYQIDFFLEDLHSRVLISHLAQKPELVPYRFALLAAASCPNDPAEFLPPELASRFPKTYSEFLRENEQRSRKEFLERLDRHRAILGKEPEGEYTNSFAQGVLMQNGMSNETRRIARLRYWLENQGHEVNFSMVFEPRGPRATNPRPLSQVASLLVTLELNLWRDLLQKGNTIDDAIRPLYEAEVLKLKIDGAGQGVFGGPDHMPIVNQQGLDELCPRLKAASLQALKGR
jgi:hypothetical protein